MSGFFDYIDGDNYGDWGDTSGDSASYAPSTSSGFGGVGTDQSVIDYLAEALGGGGGGSGFGGVGTDPSVAGTEGALSQASTGPIGSEGGNYNPVGIGSGPGGMGDEGIFSKLAKGLGVADKNGDIDISNPNTLNRILKLVAVGGNVLNTLQGPQNKKTPQELRDSLKGPFDTWNPTQQAAADAYFNNAKVGHGQAAAANMPSTIVAGRRYAEGGDVQPVNDADPQFFSGGALSLVHGPGGGQDDLVPARLGPGEYVMDADTVSALGDGSNEHGARVLDLARQELRAHKRSAPPEKIPPKAKPLAHYINKAKAKVNNHG